MSKRSNEQSNDNGEFAGKKQATDRREEPDIPPITVNMPCPADKVASLIGKRGVVIQEIIRSSGCKIQIDQNFPEGHPRQVQLIGNPKSLSSAMTQITQIISSNPDTQKSQQWEPDFYIPNEKVGGIIGSRGCVINEIMRRSGCKIQIVQDGQPEGLDRLTTFEGTSEQIKEAKQLIEQVLQEGSVELMKNAPGGENSVPSSSGGGGATRSGNYAEDEIDPHKVKVVIGVKGTTVGLIVKKSGCKVQLNQKFPQGCMHRIEYTGTPAQIETARYLVNVVTTQGDDALHAALDGMANGTLPVDNFVMQEMNVFQSQMLQLMGTHGANVNDVQWRCSVKIDIDTTPVMLPQNNIGPNGLPEPCNKVTVVGTSEGVQMAVKLLYEFIGIHIEAPPTIAPVPAYGAPQYPPVQPYGGLPAAGYQQPPGYGAPPAAYGAPPAAYGAPPAYGAPAYGAPPLAYGAPPQTYGAPAQHPYGVPQQAQPVYQPPVHMAQQQQTPEQHSGAKPATLALGQDGKAGELEAAVKLPDGSYQQVAVIKNNAIGRLQGRNSANIELIKNKSGAEVKVAAPDNSKANTRVFLTGTSQMVALASQMVQEVLVNGVGKLQQMIDVPRAVSAVAPTVAQQLPAPGQQVPYGMPASMGQHPAYNQYPPQASQNPGQVPGQFSPYGAPNPVPQYGAPPGALPQPYGQPSFPPAYGAPATNTMPPYGQPGAIPQYGQPPQQFVPPTFAQFAQPVQYNNGGRPQQQPGQNPFTQSGPGGYNTGGGSYQHGQQSKPYNNRKY